MPIPVSAIDWKSVCDSAIWRRKPFTSDPKNDNEKGFRDALIGETVAHFVGNESRKVNIAFLCNDFLLRTSVAERLRTDQRFTCYESLADFSSYIKLTREKLTNEFIKRIVRRASERFYRHGDLTCLWNKEDLYHKLSAEPHRFDVSDFNIPVMQEPMLVTGSWSQNLTGIINLSGSIPTIAAPTPYTPSFTLPTWAEHGTNKWVIGTHEFQKVSGDRTYHWKSPVTYGRRYESSYTTPTGPDMRVLTVRFNVLWKADVKDDARFYDISLEHVQFEKREFRQLADEEMKWFRFDLEQAPT